tara:strand:+ start:119 stop:1093 length:975 start_codon:yes stop_codon:yes gene_type:complete
VNSSSFFSLNSDKFYKKTICNGKIKYLPKSFLVRLKIPQIAWMFINFLEAKQFIKTINPISKKIKITNFYIDSSEINWECSSKISSPSRFLSDVFWSTQKWSEIKKTLGGKLNLLDIGCGSGLYLEKFTQYGAKIDNYTGIDAEKRKEWEKVIQKFPNVKFECEKVSNLYKILKEIRPNFIFSQSCLEHIEEDVKVIEDISNYAINSRKNIFQYHLVPAENCLWLYGLHGVRVYSPFTLKKLLKNTLNKDVSISVKALGNQSCFDLHRKYVDDWSILGSKGCDIREQRNIEYWEELKKSIINDTSISESNIASFYAIKIFHYNS